MIFVSIGTGMVLLNGACKSPKKQTVTADDPCPSLSKLTSSEINVRNKLGYIDHSSFSDRNCLNCNLFIRNDESITCGSCLTIKGPIEETGYCNIWTPIEEV